MEASEKYAESLSLLTAAQLGNVTGDEESSDQIWIDVIQKMDSIYSDLINSQVQLEEKHQELEEAHQFIDGILSSMTDILVVCDLDCRLKQVNQALVFLSGQSKEELLECRFGDLVHPDYTDAYKTFCRSVNESRELADFELGLLDRQQNAAVLSLNCSWLRDARNRVIGLVVIGRSVGELKAAYSKLDKAHQTLRDTQQQLIFTEKMAALGRLVAGVAHELNNPISFISGNVYALQRYGQVMIRYLEEIEKHLDPETVAALRVEMKMDRVLGDLESLVEGTVEGVERVSDIVHDLKRFSSKQSEPKSEFDLVPVVQTACNWVIRSAKVKPKLNHESPGEMLVVGLKGYVHQIVVNLIQNAIDMLEPLEGREITVSYHRRNGHVCVEVWDNGPGIPEEVLPHIFEPFFTTKPIGKGTGLGLSVSFNMAEELGGRLSGGNHPNGGALFSLCLPVQEGDTHV